MIRTGHVARTTAETDIDLTLCLEGSGKTSVATGFGLLDHMLTLTAFWAGFDLSLTCKGDTHIDAHHSAEDIALCLGQAFALAVGDRKGIARVGFARVPMDEALAEVTLDISGRPWLEWRIRRIRWMMWFPVWLKTARHSSCIPTSSVTVCRPA